LVCVHFDLKKKESQNLNKQKNCDDKNTDDFKDDVDTDYDNIMKFW
jgi:hypothetical protein